MVKAPKKKSAAKVKPASAKVKMSNSKVINELVFIEACKQ